MTNIDTLIYSAVASKLLEQIDQKSDLLNISVCYQYKNFAAKLTCTVIIFRKSYIDKGSKKLMIENIVPVWWDFSTHLDGNEEYNDFSWAEFKKFLIDDTI